MNTYDAITLGISIGLSILSVGIGVFAIWLSYIFSDSSSKALESVRELAKETRTLVEQNLDQQKSFSGKMLDSIIEQNKFGNGKETFTSHSKGIADAVEGKLEEIESAVNNSIEAKLTAFSHKANKSTDDLQLLIDALKEDTSKISESAGLILSKVTIPPETKEAISSFQDFPAHYAVLAAIIESEVKSLDQLSLVSDRYALPIGWESGVNNLIEQGLLVETNDGFQIPEQLTEPLRLWLEKNRKTLNNLINVYKNKDDDAVNEQELKIAKKLKF